MAENKKSPDNGAAGLRTVANIISVVAIFGFAWALILAIIESISWGSFGCFAASCVGAVILRFVLVALATIAEAASSYLESKSNNG